MGSPSSFLKISTFSQESYNNNYCVLGAKPFPLDLPFSNLAMSYSCYLIVSFVFPESPMKALTVFNCILIQCCPVHVAVVVHVVHSHSPYEYNLLEPTAVDVQLLSQDK